MDPNAFTVDGTPVVVRSSITVKDAPRLPQLIQRFGESKNGDDLVRVLTLVVESWGYDGRPQDAKSYQDLDLYDEILPIGEKAIRILNGRLEQARQQITVGDEPYEFDVDGKSFVVKKRIPLSLAPRLPSMIDRFGDTGDAADLIKVLGLVGDTSELVPNPANARDYQDLDLLTQLIPLGERVVEYLNQKLEYARTKN